jgi:hypothetical protein
MARAKRARTGVGEELGLGNMEVNQVRAIFDMFDDEMARLSFGRLSDALAELGFEVYNLLFLDNILAYHSRVQLDVQQQLALVKEFVLSKRPDASYVSLTEFMHM